MLLVGGWPPRPTGHRTHVRHVGRYYLLVRHVTCPCTCTCNVHVHVVIFAAGTSSMLRSRGAQRSSRHTPMTRAPRASNTSGCTVLRLPAHNCSRAYLVTWYLEHERGCSPLGEPHGHDVFQFGVPTDMASIADQWRHRRLPAYHHYYGFDSFVGLPEESASAERPPMGQWGPGAFSDAIQLNRWQYRLVVNRSKAIPIGARWRLSSYHPISASARPLSVLQVIQRRRAELKIVRHEPEVSNLGL